MPAVRRNAGRARVTKFWLNVCALTGQIGCMDCIEGQCDSHGRTVKALFHRCTGCGRDDVYYELEHDETCPLFRPTSEDRT